MQYMEAYSLIASRTFSQFRRLRMSTMNNPYGSTPTATRAKQERNSPGGWETRLRCRGGNTKPIVDTVDNSHELTPQFRELSLARERPLLPVPGAEARAHHSPSLRAPISLSPHATYSPARCRR